MGSLHESFNKLFLAGECSIGGSTIRSDLRGGLWEGGGWGGEDRWDCLSTPKSHFPCFVGGQTCYRSGLGNKAFPVDCWAVLTNDLDI